MYAVRGANLCIWCIAFQKNAAYSIYAVDKLGLLLGVQRTYARIVGMNVFGVTTKPAGLVQQAFCWLNARVARGGLEGSEQCSMSRQGK